MCWPLHRISPSGGGGGWPPWAAPRPPAVLAGAARHGVAAVEHRAAVLALRRAARGRRARRYAHVAGAGLARRARAARVAAGTDVERAARAVARARGAAAIAAAVVERADIGVRRQRQRDERREHEQTSIHTAPLRHGASFTATCAVSTPRWQLAGKCRSGFS